MWPTDNDTRFRSKISADYTPAGNIADRLNDEIGMMLRGPSYNYTGIQLDIKLQFDYVVKQNSILSTINTSKSMPDAVIYVDLTNELLPSVITQDEEFLLKNNWTEIAQYFPGWFCDVVHKNTYQFDMYDQTMTIKRHHALKQMVDTVNSANQPVVALGNVYTNRVYNSEYNTVVENLSFYNNKIPFLNVDRTGQLDPLINYQYIKRQIDAFYNKCQSPAMSPGWTWIDTEPLAFADPEHAEGAHPIHLHRKSFQAIAQQVQQQFDSMVTIKI
jgi:hypothetical protein